MKISGCTLRLRCSQVVPAFWAPMPMKSGDNGILPCALGDLMLDPSGTYDGGSTQGFQAFQLVSSSACQRLGLRFARRFVSVSRKVPKCCSSLERVWRAVVSYP